MATKKNTKTLKNGEYYEGSNSKNIVDVITIASKKKVYVYAKKGNDQITITKGNWHEVYGDSGTNTIKIKKGNYHYINGGKNTDKITLFAGKGISVYANAGNDTVTVNGGTDQLIYGGAGKDNIYFKYGKINIIDGEGGNDYIEVKGSNVKSGSKPVTYESGYLDSDNDIAGGAGKDTILVQAGNNYYIRGDGGNDTITVKGGTGHYIVGDAVDRITMYDKGSDSITIQNVKNSTVNGKWSNDTITVKGGCLNNRILGGEGNDTVNLSSGSGEVNFGNGNDTLNVTWSKGLAKYDVYGVDTNTVKINNLTADQLKFEKIGDWITVTANDTALYGSGSIVIQGYQTFGAGVVCKGNTVKKFS